MLSSHLDTHLHCKIRNDLSNIDNSVSTNKEVEGDGSTNGYICAWDLIAINL